MPDSPISLKFQFHKGAIRTILKVDAEEDEPTFQFHKGAIRTDSSPSVQASNFKHFNSIKVRLEPLLDPALLRVLAISIP